MRNEINNLDDLMDEIVRVDTLREEQEEYLGDQFSLLKEKVEQPIRVINRVFSLIPGSNMLKSAVSAVRKTGDKKSDWLTKVLQLATPLVLNRTILRNAGWFKKAAVVLASETAVSQVNKSSISAAVSGIANFIRPKNKFKKLAKKSAGEITAEESVESNSYGIPRDSETY